MDSNTINNNCCITKFGIMCLYLEKQQKARVMSYLKNILSLLDCSIPYVFADRKEKGSHLLLLNEIY